MTDTLRGRILDNSTEPASYYSPAGYTSLRESGTSAIVAIDKDGQACAITTTVNLIWGSQVMTSTGIVLNDELDDFGIPGQLNALFAARVPSAD